MTTQEKAKELVTNFGELPIESFSNGITIEMSKKCALIAVDELINATQYESHIQGAFNPIETCEYWQRVKTEIEKL